MRVKFNKIFVLFLSLSVAACSSGSPPETASDLEQDAPPVTSGVGDERTADLDPITLPSTTPEEGSADEITPDEVEPEEYAPVTFYPSTNKKKVYNKEKILLWGALIGVALLAALNFSKGKNNYKNADGGIFSKSWAATKGFLFGSEVEKSEEIENKSKEKNQIHPKLANLLESKPGIIPSPPVIVQKAPAKKPVIVQKAPAKKPVIVQKAPAKKPFIVQKAPAKKPVIVQKAPAKKPVIVQKAPAKKPVIVQKAPAKKPVIVQKAPEKKPVIVQQKKTALITEKDPWIEAYIKHSAEEEKLRKILASKGGFYSALQLKDTLQFYRLGTYSDIIDTPTGEFHLESKESQELPGAPKNILQVSINAGGDSNLSSGDPLALLTTPRVTKPKTSPRLPDSVKAKLTGDPEHDVKVLEYYVSQRITYDDGSQKIRKLHADYLKKSREAGTPESKQSFSSFIHASRLGDCDLQNYLLANLIQDNLGLYARVATGYVAIGGDDPIAEGHAWAEVYIPNKGWLVVDSTGSATQIGTKTRPEITRGGVQLEEPVAQIGVSDGAIEVPNKRPMELATSSGPEFNYVEYKDKIKSILSKKNPSKDEVTEVLGLVAQMSEADKEKLVNELKTDLSGAGKSTWYQYFQALNLLGGHAVSALDDLLFQMEKMNTYNHAAYSYLKIVKDSSFSADEKRELLKQGKEIWEKNILYKDKANGGYEEMLGLMKIFRDERAKIKDEIPQVAQQIIGAMDQQGDTCQSGPIPN